MINEDDIKEKIQDDLDRNDKDQGDYFGVCPKCGFNDGYMNVGRGHFIICSEHKVCWYAGWNLFSSWQSEWFERLRYENDPDWKEGMSYEEFCHLGAKQLEGYKILENGEEWTHPAQAEYMKVMVRRKEIAERATADVSPHPDSEELPF